MTARALDQYPYSAPRYYEIAFDMNRKQEVDFLVHCFRRYSRRAVKAVLDIACGTGPHLARLADHGYAMAGLDLSRANIEFLRDRSFRGPDLNHAQSRIRQRQFLPGSAIRPRSRFRKIVLGETELCADQREAS